MKKLLTLLGAASLMLVFPISDLHAQGDCDGYRTQTPGGWGAPANGNNPGVYRDAHFDTAFPDGLVIGCDEHSLTLSSAQAIEDYLPCGGQPAVLTTSYDNPDCIGNVLTGHLVAITLSLGFDAADPDFGTPDGYLGDLTINNGDFEGWTVTDAVAMANDVLGGCADDYSASQMVDVISMLNENFVDGDSNQGNLDCGGCEDETPPVVVSCPEDLALSCEDDLPETEPVFEDDSELEITYTEVWNNLDCGVEVVRTWTAVDECGNSADCVQTVAFTDDTPPVFVSWGDDMEIECSDDVPAAIAEVSENCGEAEWNVEEELIPGDCPSEYQLIRTYTATNACGLTSSAEQVINVVDTTAPVLSETPSNLELECGAEVPTPPTITALDACDGEVVVTFIEETLGDLEEGTCTLTDPEPSGDLWSMILFTFMEVNNEALFTTQSMSMVLGEDENGQTASISGSLVSVENPNGGFTVELNLINGMNWEDWSTQDFPTDYKDDFNLAGDNYLDWIYFIIDGSTSSLTGWGDYAGSYITMSHAPSNHYYGYQMGVAANNIDANYGNGGWMYYDGTFIDASQDINTVVSGAGDFAFNQFCCDSQNVSRTWTAEDCAGNVVSHTQMITFSAGGGEPPIQPALSISIEELFPNPSQERVRLNISSNDATVVNVAVLNGLGQPTGVARTGIPLESGVNTLDLNVRSLPAGIYYVHIRNGMTQTAAKLYKQ